MAQNSGFGVFLDDRPHERFLDILFENRNKSYGAFFLRRTYAMRVLTGTVITVGTVVLLLLMPYIVDWLRPKPEFQAGVTYVQSPTDDFEPPPGQQLEFMPKIEVENMVIPKVTTDTVPPEPKKKIQPPPDDKKNPSDTGGTGTQPPGGGGNNQGPSFPGIVKRYAIPPGGKGGTREQLAEDWRQYVTQHLKYPDEVKRRGVKGVVQIEVLITADGSVINPKIKKSVSTEVDAEAMRLVREMPRWTPAIKDGYPVPQWMTLTFTFDPNNIK